MLEIFVFLNLFDFIESSSSMLIMWGEVTGPSWPEEQSYSEWDDCVIACSNMDSCVLAASKSDSSSDGCFLYTFYNVTYTQSSTSKTKKLAYKLSITNTNEGLGTVLPEYRRMGYTITESPVGTFTFTYYGCLDDEVQYFENGVYRCVVIYDHPPGYNENEILNICADHNGTPFVPSSFLKFSLIQSWTSKHYHMNCKLDPTCKKKSSCVPEKVMIILLHTVSLHKTRHEKCTPFISEITGIAPDHFNTGDSFIELSLDADCTVSENYLSNYMILILKSSKQYEYVPFVQVFIDLQQHSWRSASTGKKRKMEFAYSLAKKSKLMETNLDETELKTNNVEEANTFSHKHPLVDPIYFTLGKGSACLGIPSCVNITIDSSLHNSFKGYDVELNIDEDSTTAFLLLEVDRFKRDKIKNTFSYVITRNKNPIKMKERRTVDHQSLVFLAELVKDAVIFFNSKNSIVDSLIPLFEINGKQVSGILAVPIDDNHSYSRCVDRLKHDRKLMEDANELFSPFWSMSIKTPSAPNDCSQKIMTRLTNIDFVDPENFELIRNEVGSIGTSYFGSEFRGDLDKLDFNGKLSKIEMAQRRREALTSLQELVIPVDSSAMTTVEVGSRVELDATVLDRFISLITRNVCGSKCIYLPAGVTNSAKGSLFDVFSASGGFYNWNDQTELSIVVLSYPVNHFQVGLLTKNYASGRFEIETFDSLMSKSVLNNIQSSRNQRIPNIEPVSDVFKTVVSEAFVNIADADVDVVYGQACLQQDSTSCGFLVALVAYHKITEKFSTSKCCESVKYDSCNSWTSEDYRHAINFIQKEMSSTIIKFADDKITLPFAENNIVEDNEDTYLPSNRLFYTTSDIRFGEFDTNQNDEISANERRQREIHDVLRSSTSIDDLMKEMIHLRDSIKLLSDKMNNFQGDERNANRELETLRRVETSKQVQESAGLVVSNLPTHKTHLEKILVDSQLFSPGSTVLSRILKKSSSWVQLFTDPNDKTLVLARCGVCAHQFPVPSIDTCRTEDSSGTVSDTINVTPAASSNEKLTKKQSEEMLRQRRINEKIDSVGKTPDVIERNYKSLERVNGLCLNKLYQNEKDAFKREKNIESRFIRHEEGSRHTSAIAQIQRKTEETIRNTVNWAPFDVISATKELMRTTLHTLQSNLKYSRFEENVLMGIASGGLSPTTHLSEYSVRAMGNVIFSYSSRVICRHLIETGTPFSIATDGSTDAAQRGLNVFLLRTVIDNKSTTVHMSTNQIKSHSAHATYESMIQAVNTFSKDLEKKFWDSFRDNFVSLATDGAYAVSSKNEGLYGYIQRHIENLQKNANIRRRMPLQSICINHALELVVKKLHKLPEHALTIKIIQMLHNLLSTETSQLAKNTYYRLGSIKKLTTLKMNRHCEVRWSSFLKTATEAILRSYQALLETLEEIVTNSPDYTVLVAKKARLLRFLLTDHRVFLVIHNSYRVSHIFGELEKKLQSDRSLVTDNADYIDFLYSQIANYQQNTATAMENHSFGLRCLIMGKYQRCSNKMILSTYSASDSDNVEADRHATFYLDISQENPNFNNQLTFVKFRDLDKKNAALAMKAVYSSGSTPDFTNAEPSSTWQGTLRTDADKVNKLLNEAMEESSDSAINSAMELYVMCFGLSVSIPVGRIIKNTEDIIKNALDEKFGASSTGTILSPEETAVQVNNFESVNRHILVESITCSKKTLFVDCGSSIDADQIVFSAKVLQGHCPVISKNFFISDHILHFYRTEFPKSALEYFKYLGEKSQRSKFDRIYDTKADDFKLLEIEKMETSDLLEFTLDVLDFEIIHKLDKVDHFRDIKQFFMCIMSIPPSTALVERSFSIINNFLDHKTTQMSLETVNARLSAKYNLPPASILDMTELSLMWISNGHHAAVDTSKGPAAIVESIRLGEPITFDMLLEFSKRNYNEAQHLQSLVKLYSKNN